MNKDHQAGIEPKAECLCYGLLEAIEDAACILSTDGTVLAANAVAAQSYGKATPAELVGSSIFALLPEEVDRYRRQKFSRAIESSQAVTFEDECDNRVVRHRILPVHEPGALSSRLILISTDVTQLRRADEELRREQQRQIFYLESLPGYVFLLAPDYTIRYANRYFRHAFGKIRNRKCHELFHAAGSPCDACPALNVLHSQQLSEWEWTAANGRTYHSYAYPMTDVDLTPVAMILGIDITERKTAEDALKKAQYYQQAILDNIPDLVWLKNDSNEFTAVNQAYIQRSGTTEEELHNHTDSLAWDPAVAGLFQKRDEDVLRSRQRLTSEEAIEFVDGQRRWFETVRVPILDEEGQVQGLTAIARDITERKEAVAQLMYSHSEMERHVHERTAELEKTVRLLTLEIEDRRKAEKKLAAAKKRAEVATKAKSRFLANMSHEIRTPLNVIMGMARLAQEQGCEIDGRHSLQMIRNASETLLTVINAILDFSKIEAQKISLEQYDLNLHALLQELATMHRFEAEKHGLDFTLHIGKDVPTWIKGDPARLSQVLNNLLSNAVKFTKSGGITLTVDVAPSPLQKKSEEIKLHFAVKDTGVGIPRDKRKSIFESFEQADGSITRKFGGTGLGLSISRRLVQLMGGKLSLDSTVGKGSTFFFTARFLPGTPVETLAQTHSLVAQGTSGRRLRILLAEDNPLNRELATLFLTGQGHEVLVAVNGREAVDILRYTAVDIVLMDIQMPEMDGISATKAIRGNRRLAVPSSIPIIALTAHALPGDKERFLKAGITDYLPKPLNLDHLADMLTRYLAGPETSADFKEEPASSAEQPAPPTPVALERLMAEGKTDRSTALALLQGSKTLLKRLEDVFVREAPKEVESLAAALAAGNLDEVTRLSHSMKGSAATIGATRASELAKAMEYASKTDERDELPALLQTLEEEVRRVRNYLQTEPPSS